jgi:starvation-inducible DNA-binding protein
MDNKTSHTKHLNILLSSVSISLSNSKAYHWLITGKDFFILHEKFGELYEFFALHQDKIAERILSLKAKPIVGYSNYLKHTQVTEATEVEEDKILEEILKTFDILIDEAQKVKDNADEIDDDGTEDYMGNLIYEIQKLHWQYSAQKGDDKVKKEARAESNKGSQSTKEAQK